MEKEIDTTSWIPEGYQFVTAMAATHFRNMEENFGGSERKKEKLEEREG